MCRQAIANSQLEGFPPREELRTVYMEHEIQGDLADLCCLDYVMADPMVIEVEGNTREEARPALPSPPFPP